MAEANLGFLGQFLGGLAAGKQMKQKKQLVAQDLAYKKQRNEYDVVNRKATADYRANQLTLGQNRLGLDKLKFDKEASGGEFYAKSITGVRDKIIAASNEYEKQLGLAPNGKEFKRIQEQARADLGQQMGVLNRMSKNPALTTMYPNATEDDLKGIFKAGIPSWVEQDNLEGFKPDFYAKYKANNTGIAAIRKERNAAGYGNPYQYFEREIPEYMKVIDDLDDGSGNRADTINRAIQLYGPLTGTSIQQTQKILTDGKIEPGYVTNEDYVYGEPVQIPELNPNKTFFGSPTPTGRMVDPFSVIPRKITEAQRLQLPNPDSRVQYSSPYNEPIPIPYGVQRQKDEAPYRIASLKSKAEVAINTQPDVIKAATIKNDLALQKLETGQSEQRTKYAKAYMDETKAQNYPAILTADLDLKISTAQKNKANVVTAIKNWESNTNKNYSIATNLAFSNMTKAENALVNNMNLSGKLNDAALQPDITNYLNGDTPRLNYATAQQLGSGGVEALRVVKEARYEWQRRLKEENEFKEQGLITSRNAMNAAIGKAFPSASANATLSSPKNTPPTPSQTPAPAPGGANGATVTPSPVPKPAPAPSGAKGATVTPTPAPAPKLKVNVPKPVIKPARKPLTVPKRVPGNKNN